MAKDLAKEWRKMMYGGIDQSSLKRDKESDGGYELWTRKGIAKVCYCISCHKASGAYLKETTNIIYLCDNCYNRYGGLPLKMVPQEELNELVEDFTSDTIKSFPTIG